MSKTKKPAKAAKPTNKDIKAKAAKPAKIDVDKALAPMKKKAMKEPKNLKTALKMTKAAIKTEKDKRAKSVKESEAPAVHTKTRTDKSKMPSILTSKAYIELVKYMNTEEKKAGISRTNLFVGGHVENAISTGLLSLDFVMGGGYANGRMTILPGAESSGKTTEIVTSIANATSQNVPSTVFDAESAFDAGYADRALKRFGYSMSKMQGVFDDKKQIWVEPPMVNIYQINNGEQVFKFMRNILRQLPIIRRDHNNNYWAIRTEGKKEVAEENNGMPQMCFYIDSMAALVANIMDEDTGKEPMGAQARMFAMELPRVSTLITNRNCTLVGTNQLRDKIGGFSRPGLPPPTTQPGGHALRFYTDVRTGVNACAPTTAGWMKQDKEYCEEQSVFGGIDRYAFTKFKNMKNKAFSPKREGFARIRFLANGGAGDGYCESYDVLHYLEKTGQATRRGNTVTLDIAPIKENGKLVALPTGEAKRINFLEFKKAVELPEFKHALFNHCRSQIKSGFAFDLERTRMVNNQTASVSDDDE